MARNLTSTCAYKFPLMLMEGRGEDQVCADPPIVTASVPSCITMVKALRPGPEVAVLGM